VTNWWRFSDALDSGYGSALADGRYFDFPLLRGLAGLFLSPGCGLLWMAPAVLLALPGLWSAWKRGERAWPLATLAVSVSVVLPVAMSTGWHGGWTWGPRYLLPCLPFLWLGLPLALPDLLESGVGKLAVWALGLLGLVIQIPGVLVDTMTYHDLAVQAAPVVWPTRGDPEADEEAARFEHIQWDLGFAEPWAHWRILRHRVAGLPESFKLGEVFRVAGVEPELRLRPTFGRDEGLRHLAWIDLRERLGFPLWIPFLGIGFLLALAARSAWPARA
jgi:hypothetical protein